MRNLPSHLYGCTDVPRAIYGIEYGTAVSQAIRVRAMDAGAARCVVVAARPTGDPAAPLVSQQRLDETLSDSREGRFDDLLVKLTHHAHQYMSCLSRAPS